MLTDSQVEEIRTRCEKATPGEWNVDHHLEEGEWLVIFDSPAKHDYSDIPKEVACHFGEQGCQAAWVGRSREQIKANAEFMAASRTDIPAFLADREEMLKLLREAALNVEQLAGVLKKWHPQMREDEPCVVYAAWREATDFLSSRAVQELVK